MNVKKIRHQNEQVCKPLDTYEDMLEFVKNPPSWRSLCMPLKPHSDYAIRNMDIPQQELLNPDNCENCINFEHPPTFCHFTPEMTDTEKVKRQNIKKLPKTLVCHDMANGYHDDSFIDGTGRHDAYSFYNWAAIDTFCYFSHHLITIPPLGWINVAHAHGVQVLGTVITEWNDGQQFWERVLATEAKWKEFASLLVAIAKTLKFDGWLLNVENKISAPNVLLEFVRHLHAQLHAELARAQLLWYDSVTIAGALHWQNALTPLNKEFFDACDGIFTNYSWSARDVADSAALAGARRADVFVGVDVWGRNFHGGGKFNTQQAVKVAHEHGCSLAIFAPAWTHEAIPDECYDDGAPVVEPQERFQHFLLRDRAFWGSIWSYLNTRLPNQLPFQTSFCRGQGLKRRLYGEVLCPVPWYNLRHMQYQPNSQHGPHGYLLTTAPKVLMLNKRGVVRDQDGQIRLRETFGAIEGEDKGFKPDEIGRSEQTLNNTQKNHGPPNYSVITTLKNLFFSESENALDGHSSALSLSQSVSHFSKTKHVEFVLMPVPEEKECLELFLDDSFTGGSCLKINTSDESSPDRTFIRLFHSDFYVEDTLVVCLVTKTLPNFEDQYLNLFLTVEGVEGQDLKVVLVGAEASAATEECRGDMVVYPINEPPTEDFKEVQKYLLLEEPGFYVSTFNSYGWGVRYYRARVGGGRVTSLSCRGGRGAGGVLLGHLGLCNMTQQSASTNEIIA